jgi:hypothetical protein
MNNRLEELLPEPYLDDYGIRLQTGISGFYTKEQMIEFAQKILAESCDIVRDFTYLAETGEDEYEELEASSCLEEHFTTPYRDDE